MSNYKKYGLTAEQYKALLNKSGNTCYICGKPPKMKSLCIDHDHKMARELKKKKQSIAPSVRGILCFQCNHYLIGKMGDKVNAIELFTKALEYIKEAKARKT